MRLAVLSIFVVGASACHDFAKAQQDCINDGRCSDVGAGGGTSSAGGGTASPDGGTGGGNACTAPARGTGSTATQIFRSVGRPAALATGTGNALTIAGGRATFASPLPDLISVGDALQYDSHGGTAIDSIVFIHARTDARHFAVRTEAGAVPSDLATANTSWSVFRAYTNLPNAVDLGRFATGTGGTTNSAIAAAVSGFDFDPTDGGIRDILAADQLWHFAVSADQEATQGSSVYLTSWTTDATHYVDIFAPQTCSEVGVSQRHAGVWDDTKARIVMASDYPVVQGPWICFHVEGLQIMNTDTVTGSQSAGGVGLWGGDGDEWVMLDNLVAWGGTGASNNASGLAYASGHTSSTFYFINNIVYGWPSAGIGVVSGDQFNLTVIAYNNTLVNNAQYGFYLGAESQGVETVHLVNNIVIGSASSDYSTYGPLTVNASHNLSSDMTALGDGGVQLNTVVTFNGATAHDYRLSSSDTKARGAGVDLTSDPLFPFDTDISGHVRSAPWDLGASVSVP